MSFHEFPRDESLRRKWIVAIRRDVGAHFQIREGVTKVCGLHFTKEDYQAPSARAERRRSVEGKGGRSKRRLHEGAIPSVFPFQSSTRKSNPRKPPKRRIIEVDADNASPLSSPLPSCTEHEEVVADQVHVALPAAGRTGPEGSAHLRQYPHHEEGHDEDSVEVARALLDLSFSQCSGRQTATDHPPLRPVLCTSSVAASADEMCVRSLTGENYRLRAQLMALERENEELRKAKKLAEAEMAAHIFSIHRFSEKATKVKFYTGFKSMSMFMACYRYLEADARSMRLWRGGKTRTDGERQGAKTGPAPALDYEEQFFFVCVRLKMGLLLEDLSDRLRVSVSTLSRYFTSWINLMYWKFDDLLVWPSRRRIDRNMPDCFKTHYPSTRIIIDCTEFFIERPSCLAIQSSTFSSYKNHNTVKSLVGITPDGTISFVSEAYEGSISDREVVIDSGVVNKLAHGDSVMADKGFDIQDLLVANGVRLNIPPFMNSAQRMLPQDIMKTKSIAAVRVHVERAIGRVKQFSLLDGVIDNNLFDLLEQMIFVAAMLCNFQPTLIA